ncbi:hypothetical protein KBD45_04235 [Candidatus Dojkabacteria bacterium]|nr:hypothetical protein [Candidatus Dojkabacteria bacterium]
MAINFLTENILSFVPKENWTEDEEISFGLKFVELFYVYLLKSLNMQLTDETDENFEKLLNVNPTEQQIVDFYNKLFPNLAGEIEKRAVEFKKIFIFNLYVDKINNLETMIATNRAQNKDASVYERALNNWEKILTTAKEDKWEGVLELISQLD